jgi:plasmid replication initiation protein
MLNTPESFQKDFREFRRWGLEKAHKDINGKTELRFEWEPVKQGRAVTAIRFVFSPERRVEAVATSKKKAQTKQSATSNKLFIAAVECFEREGRVCRDPDNKPKVCAFCRENVLPKE